jgi:hypothetical protein
VNYYRRAWKQMDVCDRVVCLLLSSFALFGCGSLVVLVAHSWTERIFTSAVGLAMAHWPWVTIPADLRRYKLQASVCGDGSGPKGLFCTLEPGHRGDHKNFRSNGGMIGWPQKGGA